MTDANIKQVVKDKYGEAARRVADGSTGSSCFGGSACCDPITSDLYDAAETAGLPQEAVLDSLGCGNPTALAELILPARLSRLTRDATTNPSAILVK